MTWAAQAGRVAMAWTMVIGCCSDPSPCVIAQRSTHPIDCSRAACGYAVGIAHPIAVAHAATGAGPTLANHLRPRTLLAPGRAARLTVARA